MILGRLDRSWQVQVHSLLHLLFDLFWIIVGHILRLRVDQVVIISGDPTFMIERIGDGMHREVERYLIRVWLERVLDNKSIRVELLMQLLLRLGAFKSKSKHADNAPLPRHLLALISYILINLLNIII